MPNPLYTYISNIYDLVRLGWVLWHINHCRLFNAKSSLYIYIKYIGFGLKCSQCILLPELIGPY